MYLAPMHASVSQKRDNDPFAVDPAADARNVLVHMNAHIDPAGDA